MGAFNLRVKSPFTEVRHSWRLLAERQSEAVLSALPVLGRARGGDVQQA